MLPVAETATDGLRATQLAFLEQLAESGSITKAAHRVGIHRDTPYGWMNAEGFTTGEEEDAPVGTFTYACLRAKRQAADAVLGRTYDEALSDSAGMPAAIQRMFIVKRWMPEYRDQLNVKHSGAVLSGRVDLNQLDLDERRQLLGLLQRRLEAPLARLEAPLAPPDAADPTDE